MHCPVCPRSWIFLDVFTQPPSLKYILKIKHQAGNSRCEGKALNQAVPTTPTQTLPFFWLKLVEAKSYLEANT